jgi:HSP20 family protein
MKRLRHPPSVARRMGQAASPPSDGGLGGILGGLRELAEGLQRLSETGNSEAGSGTREIDIGGAKGRMVFGYSLRVGAQGPQGEAFGHVPEHPATAPAEPPVRQPIVDVFEEADAIVVIAELPGIGEHEATARVEAGALLIETPPPNRYRKRVALPGPVEAAGLTMACRNGILEVRLPRQAGA